MAADNGNGIDVDTLEYIRQEHNEEMEVLQSIYDGDENFKILNGSVIQYKFGENEEPLSILVEISWTANYPESIPGINLECFYNQHLPPKAKQTAMKAISDEAWKNAGDQQTYTLIEWMKEHILPLIGPYVFDEVCRLENKDSDPSVPEAPEAGSDATSKKESKKEQMTKAQKRREWNRMDKDGKVARGNDWVDVVRHLSQTGGGGEGATSVSGASTSTGDSSKSSTQ